jgi:SAM-dependent methyltransferase
MYQALKSIIKRVLPTDFLLKNEPALRGIYTLLYKGSRFECNICGTQLRTFIKMKNGDKICPRCGSLQRDRRLWGLLQTGLLRANSSVLDFSPSRCLYRKLKKTKGIRYTSTDLSGHFFADEQFDITAVPVGDETYDLIICFHVLEHIEDDRRAMQELSRILKPDGAVLVQTPFQEGEIYENPAIKSPEGRLLHFGQDDHVRVYSVLGLQERLQSCGFEVEVLTYSDAEPRYGLKAGEVVLLAGKETKK